MQNRLRRAGRSDQGSVLLEMAIVFPALFALMLGIMSGAQIFSGVAVFEQAMNDAARQINRGGANCRDRAISAFGSTIHPLEKVVGSVEIHIQLTDESDISAGAEIVSTTLADCPMCGLWRAVSGSLPEIQRRSHATFEPEGAAACFADLKA